ncbi:hypothetical protein [Hymenobacter metallilatus]|uniref:Uncharacterized protein n=1 Tax=Hymenobacter metallilatus TaxID=2493666 RepID=A0A428JSW7_9BACT|nr:hypothetical protein [Hymenobacter metallilatus]RSK37136.1 hypothetical protein EI290_00260 [Hymenobacter metallilatus]
MQYQRKACLLLGFLLMPALAFAHGEDVLVPFFIQFGSVVLFTAILLLSRLAYATKAWMSLAYILTVLLVWTMFINVPFRESADVFNLLVGVAPFVATLAVYCLVNFFNKRIRK